MFNCILLFYLWIFIFPKRIVKCFKCTFILLIVTRTAAENILSSLSATNTMMRKNCQKPIHSTWVTLRAASILVPGEWVTLTAAIKIHKQRENIDIFNQELCLPPNTYWKKKNKLSITLSVKVNLILYLSYHSKKSSG